ncbi:hypothetical protein WI845_08095 [Vibrio cholerae]
MAAAALTHLALPPSFEKAFVDNNAEPIGHARRYSPMPVARRRCLV